MIAIDTSALMAIAKGEPEGERFAIILDDARVVLLGSPTLFEFQMVAIGRFGPEQSAGIFAEIMHPAITVIPFDAAHVAAAFAAFERYGKGRRHPAGLNHGDCMAYAVAKVAGCPLLFKGNDFVHTDIARAA